MKGLEAYLNKHGKHFTEELAMSITDGKWDSIKVSKMSEKKAYYNVTSSTLGDMVYLTNEIWDDRKCRTIHGTISLMLCFVGDYKYYDGKIFNDWLNSLTVFDFTPYI